jgi:hypothetical protein
MFLYAIQSMENISNAIRFVVLGFMPWEIKLMAQLRSCVCTGNAMSQWAMKTSKHPARTQSNGGSRRCPRGGG